MQTRNFLVQFSWIFNLSLIFTHVNIHKNRGKTQQNKLVKLLFISVASIVHSLINTEQFYSMHYIFSRKLNSWLILPLTPGDNFTNAAMAVTLIYHAKKLAWKKLFVKMALKAFITLPPGIAYESRFQLKFYTESPNIAFYFAY